MSAIDKESSSINIYNWNWSDVNILELKNWVDTQISKGKTKVELNISWGYYSDIDSLELEAKN